MKAIIPFKLKLIPIKKLALINFEKDPDDVYRGLELQYLDGEPYGIGWRVIAYRYDNYVDVYDDYALNTIENEKFDVAENGLANYAKTEIREVRFEKNEYGAHICFSFKDMFNRNISVQIHENTRRHSKAMNLLAPIGAGSKKPTSFPLFFLYEFDFIRKHKTQISIDIDGNKRKVDNFPFPLTKELQWRYYTRYSMDCQMVELAKSEDRILTLVELDEDYSYTEGQTTYYFDNNKGEVSLKSIEVHDKKHKLEMHFDLPLPIQKKNDEKVKGKFFVTTDSTMGIMEGIYHWEQLNGTFIINLSLDKGWTSVPNSVITKMILGPKSIFCTWPKSYNYMQEIQKDSLRSKSEWINSLV
ncbi:hypothetical protein SAMN05660462_01267 [Proteiniborus ethanoligenes]|uniref:Uncharacterized protein n=1 Tax=Proteiniborus ethanoligenes TaxID=415015 RepID=A0A1H3NVB1_9FIRM|nr:hypothetical protein [Proteiniborus ethanoligenes]SDY92613.1 hypothetical protein SAMN05660462_01267 [Proteiniborus ethanoligenes]